MITAVVRFPLPAGTTRDDAKAMFEKSAPNYRGVKAVLGDTDIDNVANALSYAALALGLNVVVGFAGLLDLGYAAFFAIGAYFYGILTSFQVMPLWSEGWAPLAMLGLVEKMNQGGPDLVHFTLSFWLALPAAALVTAFFGILFGAPTLRLRGDYLAIVTLGFGEIFRIAVNNTDGTSGPDITNGSNGIASIPDLNILGFDLGVAHDIGGFTIGRFANYFFLMLLITAVVVLVFRRSGDSRIVAAHGGDRAAAQSGISRCSRQPAFDPRWTHQLPDPRPRSAVPGTWRT